MKETLDTLHPIDAKQLHPQCYTQCLIWQAASCNILSESQISKIQLDLFEILAEQCDKWNQGESSSVPIEKAQDMMNSILFVISLKLKTYVSPEHAVEVLKSEKLKEIFENGLQIVRQKMTSTKHLQNQIVEHLLETPNVFYRSTIVDGINGFFHLYRPQFAAQELHITVDYPVFIGRSELDGIEFIEQYLHCIEAENDFCIQFLSKDIHDLLCGLTKDYQNVPMNLYEYVMLSALGLVMQKRSPQKLNLTSKDVENLHALFEGKSNEEIFQYLEKAVVMLERYGLLPKTTRVYLQETLQKFVPTIYHAVQWNTLDKVFLVPVHTV